MTPADEDALWLGLVSLAVMLTWSYDLYRASSAVGHASAPVPMLTNARGLFRSATIMVGLLRITLGSFVRAYPDTSWLVVAQSALAPVLTLLLLTGGLVLIVLWKLEDRERSDRSRD